MILVDTSVWIDHLRRHDAMLARLLGEGQVLAHPFVTGELALGNLRNRDTVVNALRDCHRLWLPAMKKPFASSSGMPFSGSALATSTRTCSPRFA